MNENGQWIQFTYEPTIDIRDLRGKRIVDLLRDPDPGSSAYFQLDNGWLITVDLVAPWGLSAGLRIELSVDDLAARWQSELSFLSRMSNRDPDPT